MNWPLDPPPAGECALIPLLFEPGTIIGGLEITEQGAFLRIDKPMAPVDGAPVQLAIYLCPPDPEHADAYLCPLGHLQHGGKWLGKIEGPNGIHAVIIRQM